MLELNWNYLYTHYKFYLLKKSSVRFLKNGEECYQQNLQNLSLLARVSEILILFLILFSSRRGKNAITMN